MALRSLFSGFILVLASTGIGIVLGYIVWHGDKSPTEKTDTVSYVSSAPLVSADKRHILYWANPMNPEIHADHPMKDNMGMKYIPVYASAGAENKVSDLHISPRMAQTLGVQLATVQMRPMAHVFHSVGIVTVDDNRTYTITSRFTGWIKQLNVRATGDKVHRGQVLAEVYSPELLSAQEEYLVARQQDGAGGGSEILKATRDRLRRFGMPEAMLTTLERTGKAIRDTPIVSPESGVVSTLNIRQGGYVASGNNLYEVANLDRIWVKVALYSYQLPWVKIGDQVRLESPYYPGKVWKGRLTFLYPTLDPKTRTISARVSIPNPGDVLRPGMYMNATLSANSQTALAVPSSAVLQTDNGDFAMMYQNQGHFLPVELALGPEADGWTAVTRGLKLGEKVVDNAQFLLYSASQFQNVKARMLGGDDATKSPAMSSGIHHPPDIGSRKGKSEEKDSGISMKNSMSVGAHQ